MKKQLKVESLSIHIKLSVAVSLFIAIALNYSLFTEALAQSPKEQVAKAKAEIEKAATEAKEKARKSLEEARQKLDDAGKAAKGFPQPSAIPSSSNFSLSELESKFLSNARQITFAKDFQKAGEGYFSPDGKEIVYQAVPNDYIFYQIFRQPLAGGEPVRISTGRGRTTCSYFTSDGKGILFASSHLDPRMGDTEGAERKQLEEDKKSGKRRRYSWDFDPYTDIFVGDRDGKNLKNLTNTLGYDAEGAYSPDGKLIAFCSDREKDEDGKTNPDIYVMNNDGSNVRRLTTAKGYDGGPFISPNGKWIVFRSDRKKAEHLQIHVIGVDGKNDTALTDTVGVNWAPYWHPTKPYIIWTGADHSNPTARPNYDLWLMKYEENASSIKPAGPITRITDHEFGDVLPVFSPDGKQLMWTSNRVGHQSQLFIVDFKLPESSDK